MKQNRTEKEEACIRTHAEIIICEKQQRDERRTSHHSNAYVWDSLHRGIPNVTFCTIL